MKRSYESGAAKRKKRMARQEEEAKGRRSINSFFQVSNSAGEPSGNGNSPADTTVTSSPGMRVLGAGRSSPINGTYQQQVGSEDEDNVDDPGMQVAGDNEGGGMSDSGGHVGGDSNEGSGDDPEVDGNNENGVRDPGKQVEWDNEGGVEDPERLVESVNEGSVDDHGRRGKGERNNECSGDDPGRCAERNNEGGGDNPGRRVEVQVDSVDAVEDENEERRPSMAETPRPQHDVSNDPGTWVKMKTVERDCVVLKGPPPPPKSEEIPRDSSGRAFPPGVLSTKLTNGETVDRDWMVWSKELSAFLCFPCCLFKDDPQSKQCHSKFVEGGFDNNWRKVYERAKGHESSVQHLGNYIKWKELKQLLAGEVKGVDKGLLEQIREEERNWREILHVIVDVVLFLAERGIAFRGGHSTIDQDDCGNFLSLLKLLSRYNPVLKKHLQNVADCRMAGKRMAAHYLSWESQNEFLEICGAKVLQTILDEVREARYYSILIDGTPDVSHKEQVVFILRYVLKKEKWDVYERFIKLTDFEQKTGAALSGMIDKTLAECDLQLQWCRGQGYDNASNMSGKFKGVKSRILEANPQAYFSPCGPHTLNLMGVHAMETSNNIKSFFGNTQKLYTVFSSSPARWKVLMDNTKASLHSVSTTRWSARVDAVRPLIKNYSGILRSLFEIAEELNLPAETQSEVDGLIAWLQSFEFVLLISVWWKLLQCIDDRNAVIQSANITLKEEAATINGLIGDVQKIRDSWQNILEEARLVATTLDIKPELKRGSRIARMRKLKRFFDDTGSDDHTFDSLEDKFKVEVFTPAIDVLLTELRNFSGKLDEVSTVFSPILFPENIDDVTETTLEGYAETLAEAYPSDLEEGGLKDEFRLYFQTIKDSIICVKGQSALGILNTIFEKGLECILPQICVALRLFIVLPVSVASGERAFSKLGLVKNKLRSTTGQDRLNHLLSINIEHDIVKQISFESVINDFAQKRARKVKF